MAGSINDLSAADVFGWSRIERVLDGVMSGADASDEDSSEAGELTGSSTTSTVPATLLLTVVVFLILLQAPSMPSMHIVKKNMRILCLSSPTWQAANQAARGLVRACNLTIGVSRKWMETLSTQA